MLGPGPPRVRYPQPMPIRANIANVQYQFTLVQCGNLAASLQEHAMSHACRTVAHARLLLYINLPRIVTVSVLLLGLLPMSYIQTKPALVYYMCRYILYFCTRCQGWVSRHPIRYRHSQYRPCARVTGRVLEVPEAESVCASASTFEYFAVLEKIRVPSPRSQQKFAFQMHQ